MTVVRLFRSDPVVRATVGLLLPASIAGMTILGLRLRMGGAIDTDLVSVVSRFFLFLYPLAWGALFHKELTRRADDWALSLPIGATTLWNVRTMSLIGSALTPLAVAQTVLFVVGRSGSITAAVAPLEHLAGGLVLAIVVVQSLDLRLSRVRLRVVLPGFAIALLVVALALFAESIGTTLLLLGASVVLATVTIFRLPHTFTVMAEKVTAPAVGSYPRIRFNGNRGHRATAVLALRRTLLPWWLFAGYLGAYALVLYLHYSSPVPLVLWSFVLIMAMTIFLLPVLRRLGSLDHLPLSRSLVFTIILLPGTFLIVLVCVQGLPTVAPGEGIAPDLPPNRGRYLALVASYLGVLWTGTMSGLMHEFRTSAAQRTPWLLRLGLLVGATSMIADMIRGDASILMPFARDAGRWLLRYYPESSLAAWSLTAAMFFVCYLTARAQFLRIELPINDDHQASDQSG